MCIVNVCGAPGGAEGYTKLCFSRCEDGSAPDLEAIVEVRELLYISISHAHKTLRIVLYHTVYYFCDCRRVFFMLLLCEQ